MDFSISATRARQVQVFCCGTTLFWCFEHGMYFLAASKPTKQNSGLGACLCYRVGFKMATLRRERAGLYSQKRRYTADMAREHDQKEVGSYASDRAREN